MYVLIIVYILTALGPNAELVRQKYFDKVTAQADCQAALAALTPQPTAPYYAGCLPLTFLPANAIVQPVTQSATVAMAPTGTLTFNGQAITFGPTPGGNGDYPILANGSQLGSGAGIEVAVANSTLYALSKTGPWFQWSGTGWNQLSAKPAGVP